MLLVLTLNIFILHSQYDLFTSIFPLSLQLQGFGMGSQLIPVCRKRTLSKDNGNRSKLNSSGCQIQHTTTTRTKSRKKQFEKTQMLFRSLVFSLSKFCPNRLRRTSFVFPKREMLVARVSTLATLLRMHSALLIMFDL